MCCHDYSLPTGRLITELRVPGIKFGFVKRPYDIGLQVQVEDLFLVDPIPAFGAGNELVICSSGSKLFDLPTTSLDSTQLAKDDFTSTSSLLSPRTHPEVATPEEQQELDYSVFSNDGLPIELFSTSLEENDHALLVLSYSLLTPDSPQHPATRDWDDETPSHVTDEPNIHRVSLQCTAVDAIGELISLDKVGTGDNGHVLRSLTFVESRISKTISSCLIVLQ